MTETSHTTWRPRPVFAMRFRLRLHDSMRIVELDCTDCGPVAHVELPAEFVKRRPYALDAFLARRRIEHRARCPRLHP